MKTEEVIHREWKIAVGIGYFIIGVVLLLIVLWLPLMVLTGSTPRQIKERQQSAAIRARVAPLKTAVRQLKSGPWRITLETQDGRVQGLQRGAEVVVSVR